jgi:hypothetical protein
VITQILGEKEAPWEAAATAPFLLKKLGHFKAPVLSMLARNALERPSMAEFQLACSRVLRSSVPPQTNPTDDKMWGHGA